MRYIREILSPTSITILFIGSSNIILFTDAYRRNTLDRLNNRYDLNPFGLFPKNWSSNSLALDLVENVRGGSTGMFCFQSSFSLRTFPEPSHIKSKINNFCIYSTAAAEETTSNKVSKKKKKKPTIDVKDDKVQASITKKKSDSSSDQSNTNTEKKSNSKKQVTTKDMIHSPSGSKSKKKDNTDLSEVILAKTKSNLKVSMHHTSTDWIDWDFHRIILLFFL